jgi:hypothetical protein
VLPAGTSVPKDWTRGPCAGGVKVPEVTVDHVISEAPWVGLVVVVGVPPRPPPNWPTITNEVGILLTGPPTGVNDRLLVRLIWRDCPVGTVITTGDHPPELFSGAQLALTVPHV